MELNMKMFMSILLAIGIIISYFSYDISKLTNKCSMKAQDCARLLLILGIVMISVSSTFMICGCSHSLSNSLIGMFFVIFMLVVGVLTISLTSIIHSECPDARSSTPILLTLSVLTTVASAGYLGYLGYDKYLS